MINSENTLERQRDRDSERERESDSERETDRETDRERQRQTDRQRKRVYSLENNLRRIKSLKKSKNNFS